MTGKTGVILQPSYIPWRGYFHQIAKADVFIFYDDVKYDKHGWRNRNRIKTPSGSQWLTIPVFSKGVEKNRTPIDQIEINWNQNWNRKHWTALELAYGKAPFFERYAPLISGFYEGHPTLLAEFTIDTTIQLAQALGITSTEFTRSSMLTGISGQKTDRLIQILTQLDITHYISGPSAKEYIDTEQFDKAGISLEYMVYDYPEYDQLYPPFDPQVSVLDLLFMCGPNALNTIL
jgi:WbqC-like protein family